MADQTVALGTVGQGGEGAPPVAQGVAIERPLTRKGLPLAHPGEREPRGPAQCRGRPGSALGRQAGLVKVIHHDIQTSEEGVAVDPRRGVLSG